MADAYITGLDEAEPLAGSELLEISQLSPTVTITAATISAQASDNSYNDSGSGFVAAGFAQGDRVRVTGFTGNVLNNIFVGVIATLTTAKMTIASPEGDALVDDAAGESVTITKWVTRRHRFGYLSDLFDTDIYEPADGDILIWDSSADAFVNGPNTGGSAGAGQLIGKQVITATGAGTYTPTGGTSSIVIEMVGAGGGSSGVAAPGSGNAIAGAAGGGGAYLKKRLTANFSGASYSVGAGGGGGSSGNNAGNNGNDTTFTETGGGGTVYTAGGGVGGPASNAGTIINGILGANGGSATNGDINISGSAGQTGQRNGAQTCWTGNGGNSRLGFGGRGAVATSNNTNANGTAGQNYGGGASAPASTGTAGALGGQSGANGILIIWEYS